MLTYLGVQNIRSFGKRQGIDIRPLTIVMGKNSSGKSSLLRSMFLLRQTADVRERAIAAVFDGPFAQFGSFYDFAHMHESSAEVGVSWSLVGENRNAIRMPLEDSANPRFARGQTLHSITGIHLDAKFSYNRRTTEVRSQETRLEIGLRRPAIMARGEFLDAKHWTLTLERRRLDNRWSEITYRSDDDEMQGSYKIQNTGKFYDLSIGRFHARQGRSGPFTRLDVRRMATAAAAYIEAEVEKWRLLGPIRTEARRFYLLTGERPQEVGLAGEKSVELLWMGQRSRRGFGEFLRRWLEAFDISVNIRLRRLPRTSYVSVELTDPKTGAVVPLADVGVGASQLLPILIGGYSAPPGATLVVEQPELHLHPAAQGEMGDALIEIMEGGRSLVVETHSEHLVRRIQRRIAEQSLSPERVALYYVDETKKGSVVVPIPLDKQGSFVPEMLPPGFFDVDFNETTAITAAWRAKKDE